MYFNDENARKIDSIREMIEFFKIHNLINENEYFILLATLLESVSLFANVAGVYAAFCKKWDSRAIKPFRLKELELISTKSENLSFCGDSFDFLQDLQAQGTHIDILYLDPPYNHRQYAPNYHLLETIARYDNPSIKGIAGLRDYATQKSRFCNAKTALSELEKYIKLGNYTYFVLSYNSEGIMQKAQIEEILKPLNNMKCVETAYPRFKSNAKKAQRFIKEYVWIGRA